MAVVVLRNTYLIRALAIDTRDLISLVKCSVVAAVPSYYEVYAYASFLVSVAFFCLTSRLF